MRQPVCIVHAGTEKTGTTSLQRFLCMNAPALSERGIWIPRSLVQDPIGGPYNHMLLSTASRLGIPEPDDLQLALGFKSMESITQHRQAVVDALAAERSAMSYQPSTIIVSSEHIHSRLRTDDDAHRARALLAPFCANFRVIVYLRSQYELAQSVAVTAVRHGATEFRRIPDFNTENGYDELLGLDYDYFDYHQLLERLQQVFGAGSLQPRIYGQGEMLRDDVVEDFFGHLGIDIAGMPRPGRENTSMRENAIQFLLKFNRHLDKRPNAAFIRERALAYLALTHRGSAQHAAHAEIERFMSLFEASNESVRSRWFPHRRSLFAQPPAEAKIEHTQSALSEADAFSLFIELFSCAVEGV